MRPRSAAASLPHSPEPAFRAASTAASISLAPPAASVPIVSPVDGSSTGSVAFVWLQRPPMSSFSLIIPRSRPESRTLNQSLSFPRKREPGREVHERLTRTCSILVVEPHADRRRLAALRDVQSRQEEVAG